MSVPTITQFSDLPSCLVEEILLRLPTQTLLICRFVCIDWFRLFCNPFFIKLHLAASPIHYLWRYLYKGSSKFQCGRILDDGAHLRSETLTFALKLNLPDEFANLYWCTNSCNGLVCLQSVAPDSVFVANPVLGELVIIPPPPRIRSGESRFALGFSAKTNQYKVLFGFEDKTRYGDFFELGIYTLGSTREWRIINAEDEALIGCGIWDCLQSFPVLHGSLHWANRKRHMMYAFDVENEKLKRFSLPRPRWVKKDFYLQVGIINGYVCVVFCTSLNSEIWAMKEYGIEKSWTLMFASIKHLLPTDKDIIIHEEVCSKLLFPLNEEEILIANPHGRAVSLNNRRMRQRTCDTKVGASIGYNPSFVSLQDVAKGEQVMVSKWVDQSICA